MRFIFMIAIVGLFEMPTFADVQVQSYEDALNAARTSCALPMVVFTDCGRGVLTRLDGIGMSVVGGAEGTARGAAECSYAQQALSSGKYDWVCSFVDAVGTFISLGTSTVDGLHLIPGPGAQARNNGLVKCENENSTDLCFQEYGTVCFSH